MSRNYMYHSPNHKTQNGLSNMFDFTTLNTHLLPNRTLTYDVGNSNLKWRFGNFGTVYATEGVSNFENISVTDTLTTGQDVNVGNDLTVLGELVAQNVSMSDLNVLDELTVGGVTTINDNLNVNGVLDTTSLQVDTTANITQGLTVGGVTNVNNNLNVSGVLDTSSLQVDTNANVDGAIQIDGNLRSGEMTTGTASLYGSLGQSKAIIWSGTTPSTSNHAATLSVMDNASASGTTGGRGGSISLGGPYRDYGTDFYGAAARISSTTNTAIYGGDLRLETCENGVMSERVRITPFGDVGVGTTTPQSRLHCNGTMTVDGVTNINNNLNVSGVADVNSLQVDTSTNITQGLTVGGVTNMNNNLNVSGVADVNSLQVDTSANITQQLAVGGLSFLNSDVTMSQDLDVLGKTKIDENLVVGGELVSRSVTNKLGVNFVNMSGSSTINFDIASFTLGGSVRVRTGHTSGTTSTTPTGTQLIMECNRVHNNNAPAPLSYYSGVTYLMNQSASDNGSWTIIPGTDVTFYDQKNNGSAGNSQFIIEPGESVMVHWINDTNGNSWKFTFYSTRCEGLINSYGLLNIEPTLYEIDVSQNISVNLFTGCGYGVITADPFNNKQTFLPTAANVLNALVARYKIKSSTSTEFLHGWIFLRNNLNVDVRILNNTGMKYLGRNWQTYIGYESYTIPAKSYVAVKWHHQWSGGVSEITMNFVSNNPTDGKVNAMQKTTLTGNSNQAITAAMICGGGNGSVIVRSSMTVNTVSTTCSAQDLHDELLKNYQLIPSNGYTGTVILRNDSARTWSITNGDQINFRGGVNLLGRIVIGSYEVCLMNWEHVAANGSTVFNFLVSTPYDLNIRGYLQFFPTPGTSPEFNAGKIGYQQFSTNLDIVGAGTTEGTRGVRIHDFAEIVNAGTNLDATLTLKANASQTNRPVLYLNGRNNALTSLFWDDVWVTGQGEMMIGNNNSGIHTRFNNNAPLNTFYRQSTVGEIAEDITTSNAGNTNLNVSSVMPDRFITHTQTFNNGAPIVFIRNIIFPTYTQIMDEFFSKYKRYPESMEMWRCYLLLSINNGQINNPLPEYRVEFVGNTKVNVIGGIRITIPMTKGNMTQIIEFLVVYANSTTGFFVQPYYTTFIGL